VVSLLQLQKLNNRITIGNNLKSNKMGSKGIIKVADKFFREDELNRIALVAPNVNLNIIRNFEVVEKKKVVLPDEIVEIMKCNNPKCITNNEPMKTRFHVTDKEKVELQCHYCEVKIKKEEVVLL
jgi:aspartate carbamoyltransferase regulatory subunit